MDAPPGAPSSNRRAPSLLRLVGIGVLAVTIPAAIVGAILFFSADLRAATHDFLARARAGDHERAYAMTTAAFHARVSADAFPSYLSRQAPELAQSTGEWINGFGGDGSEECVEAWLDSGGTVYVMLTKEDGAWRVDAVEHVEPDLCDSD